MDGTAAERVRLFLFGLVIIVWLTMVIGIGYVAMHFIMKYW